MTPFGLKNPRCTDCSKLNSLVPELILESAPSNSKGVMKWEELVQRSFRFPFVVRKGFPPVPQQGRTKREELCARVRVMVTANTPSKNSKNNGLDS